MLTRLLLGRISLNRVLGDRVLARAARDHARPGLRVLVTGAGRHVGSSEAAVLDSLPRPGRAFTVDLTAGRSPHVAADLSTAWPFREDSFDLILSTWVLEHVVDPGRFLAEACRALRPGGAFICAVPFIYRKHASPDDYWRFTDTAIVHLGRAAGFAGVEVRPVGGTPFLSSVNLLWPVLQLPLIGVLALLVAWILDRGLILLTAASPQGRELVTSYPIGYVVILRKP